MLQYEDTATVLILYKQQEKEAGTNFVLFCQSRNMIGLLSVRDCLGNFLLLPISLEIHKNPKNVLVLQEKNIRSFIKLYSTAI